ncbi:hypothetical protein b3_0352 [Synechococcus phage B3]|nr:hypothetical protein b3_0352 [Synechococcus phage B3]QGT54952.1 hypothetical protein b23_0346 [Synechococcus phage B23]
MRNLDKFTTYRYLGNLLIIVGYYILLWQSESVGLIIKLVGTLMAIPSLYVLKLWDALVICGFFALIEFSRLLYLINQ